MLEKYLDILDSYRTTLEQYNCSLKTGRGWTNSLRKEQSASRLPFENGYECYIYCEAQKDGKEVRIESNDGESDYYALSASWIISSIEKKFFKLYVSLYSAADDIEDDMKELFR